MSAPGDWRVARVMALRQMAQALGRDALEQLDGAERASLELAAADVARVSLVLERIFQIEPADTTPPPPPPFVQCGRWEFGDRTTPAKPCTLAEGHAGDCEVRR